MATARIKIVARLRPRIVGEIDDQSVQVLREASGSMISVTNPRDPTQVFKFPCYDENSNQEEIFMNDVQPMIDVVYSGVTVTIFAYGVTSSGKTHTMQGTKAEPGVIPRTIRDEVYDLLVTRENAPKLPVRENDAGMVFVANLTSEPISSVEEFDAIYNQATKHRSVGSTNLNRASSRSHAVLTIEARMYDPIENKTLTGKINLVDLAGSENNKLTGNDPSRMAESAAINKSLSVLGQVVHALNSGASRIPYRNSKLTRILQDALGGTSIGLLICNLAPGTKFRQDTLNTLNFAVRTKNIENKPVINERDNRPVPKPHFAAVAIQPPPGKPAPAILQPISTAGSTAGSGSSVAPGPGPGAGPGPRKSRKSMVPVARMSRPSIAGGYQPFTFPGAAGRKTFVERIQEEEYSDRSSSMTLGLTEKEIDERISRAVEAEVTRRLAERERQRELEEQERRAREQELEAQQRMTSPDSALSRSPSKKGSLPAGVLTPLLKRHRDLDDELKARLQELERKYERGNKETQLADVLSPVSKKKTGRAYVALARAHSEKGDLQVALDLYRKAESYVPDNIKLKERIIEIEWAVKNNRVFVPSPRKSRKHKKSKAVPNENRDMDVDEDTTRGPKAKQFEMDEFGVLRQASEFGIELTNAGGGSPSKAKRHLDGGDENVTPPKKQKQEGTTSESGDEEDWVLSFVQTVDVE
ncbi:hypothetical protein H0H92_012858 [Tricholoma furcatifolium]|nr:hypothetical protein H0H92_012858 [Tricholoma furcatifolium]